MNGLCVLTGFPRPARWVVLEAFHNRRLIPLDNLEQQALDDGELAISLTFRSHKKTMRKHSLDILK